MINKTYANQIHLRLCSIQMVVAGFSLVITLFIEKGFAQRAIGEGDQQTTLSNVSLRDNPSPSPVHSPSAALRTGRAEGLRGAGMSFTENKGQVVDMAGKICPDILFKGDGGRFEVYLRKTGISYVQSNIGDVIHQVHEEIEELEKSGGFGDQSEHKTKEKLLDENFFKLNRIDLDFEGSNPNPQVETADLVEGYTNYYYPHCPKGITGVNSFNRVTIKNIYNNIDVMYYASTSLSTSACAERSRSGGTESGLKYDIIINPGGNPNDIKIKYRGAEVKKLANGSLPGGPVSRSALHTEGRQAGLQIASSLGVVNEYMPKVYQNINGKIVDVKAEYRLEPLSDNDVIVHFSFSTFNSSFPLVIDPWVTYFGGSNNEGGKAVTTDKTGNAIFTGLTTSVNLPVSPGAFQVSLKGSSDSYIVKFSASGARMFATYFGGTDGNDDINSVASDSNSDIFVTGFSSSSNLPTKAWGAAYMKFWNNGGDAFVAKFTSAGLLIWSTYYGGSSGEESEDIAIDAAQSIIITGHTFSSDFPTVGAFQPSKSGTAGSYDVFVVKFNNIGSVQWATYFAGNSSDKAYGIITDQTNKIYVCGETMSVNFPILSAFQPVGGGGSNVGFLFCLDPAIGFPLWSTFYGGVGTNVKDVTVDNSGNIIIVGTTGSATNIASPGAFKPAIGTLNGDAFLVKFNNAGNRQWGTYIGGATSGEFGAGVATDSNNNIYVFGETEDRLTYFISTCAYQPVFGGIEDQFVEKYDADGQQKCITTIGGPSHDELNYEDEANGGIAVYGNVLYITGQAGFGYPVTPGAYQTVYGGANIIGDTPAMDAYLDQLCINICEAKTLGLNYAASTTSVCPNAPVTFTPSVANSCDTSGYRFLWTFNGGTPATSTAVKPTVSFSGVGPHNVKLVLTTLCKKDSLIKASYINVNSCSCTMTVAALVSANTNCSGSSNGSANVTITAGSGGTYSYNWSTGNSGTTASTTISATGLSAGAYTVTITDGACVSVTTVSITQTLSVNSVSSTGISCNGGNNGIATVTISGGGGSYTYNWSNGANSITGSSTSQVSNLTSGTYTVTVKQGSCTSTSTVTVTEPLKLFAAISGSWSCTTNITTATVYPADGTSPYAYIWSSGATTPTAAALNTGTYGVTVTDKNGCTVTRSITTTNSPMVMTTSSQNISCTTGGYASVNVTSGIAPYSYNWSNNLITPSVNGLSAGTYTVTVSDRNGCAVTRTFTITGTSPVSATFTQPPTICLGSSSTFNNTGTAIAGATYNWLISSGALPMVSGTTNNFSYTFLATGSYSIQHTVTSGGCTAIQTSNITVINCSSITVSATGNSVCAGFCATITSLGANGTAPYTYNWNTGATTQNINSCPASTTTYTVTIRDAGGNTSTSTAVVTVNPALSVAISPSNVSCSGASTGSATATGGSGSLPYTYNWSGGVPGSGFQVSGLSAGTYTVTLTDSKGCTAISTATIISPQPLSGQFTKGTANCIGCGCKEWIVVNASGGTSPYNYTWPDGYVNRYKNQLCPGAYNINIRDKNGCSINVSLTTP